MIDLFTPWQESADALRARTVGRDAVVAAVDAALSRFARGERVAPVLIVGPRGAGKSHLVALARDRAGSLGLPSRFVSEDVAPSRTADELWERMRYGEDWSARRWTDAAPVEGRFVALVEGLDRQLDSLRDSGAAGLRRLLGEGLVALVATAVEVPNGIADAAGPFYGQFDVWRLGGLDPAQAEDLARRVLAEPSPTPDGERRAKAVVRLAGGQPRSIVALADACRGEGTEVAEALERTVSALVPHYQMQLRDRSRDEQHALESLALAPRALQPGELDLGNPSVPLGRLRDDGLVERTQEGRESWYRVQEPLIRYVLEHRTAGSWERTRASVVARLIGEVLSRDEVAHVWWKTGRRELLDVPEVRDGITAELIASASLPDRLPAVLRRAVDASIDENGWLNVLQAAIFTRTAWWSAVPDGAPRIVRQLAAFAADPSRAGFQRLIDGRLADPEVSKDGLFDISMQVRDILDVYADPRGRPWRRAFRGLERLPWLRMRFVVEGRRATDEGVVDPARVTLRASDPDLVEALSAAMLVDDESLWRRAAALARMLPTCPTPAKPAPAEGFGELARKTGWRGLLTWAATFSDLSEADWRTVLGAERVGPLRPPPDLSGFVRLALRGSVPTRGVAPQADLAGGW